MSEDPAKQAWQASVEVAGAPSLDQARRGAKGLYRGVWIRNAIEYAACVVILFVFAPQMFTADGLRRLGAMLTVAGILFVAWQLHNRASADHPDRAGTMPILQFVRAQLVRQRDAIRGVLWWYILPLFPGILVNWLANMRFHLSNGTGTVAGGLLVLVAMLLIAAGVWWLNQRAARKLQRHIDEIDALTGGDE